MTDDVSKLLVRARTQGLNSADIIGAHGLPSNSEACGSNEGNMPKFVIEREIPGAGNLSSTELQAISQKSCGVLRELGPQVQWVQSYVTDDKVYCVYIAPDADSVRRHAELGEFPANSISEVRSIIDPTTAD